PLALSQQRACCSGSVDHVTGLLGFPGFGQAAERLGIGKDLGGLPHRQILLDRDQDRLLQAAALGLGDLLELSFNLGRQAKSHGHTIMVSLRCGLVSEWFQLTWSRYDALSPSRGRLTHRASQSESASATRRS